MTAPARPPAVLIAGPTASGKSALALCLAERHGGVVVNVDSMQVYRDLSVLSARPSPDDEMRAPHRLYGDVDGAENHSVGRFLARAAPLIDELVEAGRLPILVGGTGLYFKVLREGLSEVPPVPDTLRERVRRETADAPTSALHARLATVDPASAERLAPGDRLRVLRALEVFEATGQPIGSFLAARGPAPLAGLSTVNVFLDAPRDPLRARIDARFAAMVAQGALDEVAALRARCLDPLLPVMRAHGVPALLDHLSGGIGLDEAIAHGQADTRRYAKRQFTFFRHQMAESFAFVPPEVALAHIERALGT